MKYLLVAKTATEIPSPLDADISLVLPDAEHDEHWFFVRFGNSKFPVLQDSSSGLFVSVTGTIAQAMVDLGEAAYRVALARAASDQEKSWPVFAAHPATNEIPSAGLTYRIDEGAGLVTWWVARQGDLIATQISAHDASGNAIISSVDLRTGTQTILSTASLPKTTKKAKQKGKP